MRCGMLSKPWPQYGHVGVVTPSGVSRVRHSEVGFGSETETVVGRDSPEKNFENRLMMVDVGDTPSVTDGTRATRDTGIKLRILF